MLTKCPSNLDLAQGGPLSASRAGLAAALGTTTRLQRCRGRVSRTDLRGGIEQSAPALPGHRIPRTTRLSDSRRLVFVPVVMFHRVHPPKSPIVEIGRGSCTISRLFTIYLREILGESATNIG